MSEAIILPTQYAFKNLTDQKFGSWTVLSYAGIGSGGNAYWNCVCKCGYKDRIHGSRLRLGRSTKCINCRSIRHGHSTSARTTQEYQAWANMVQRCTNPKCGHYGDYGARGITVCEPWLTFDNFLSDMGLKPGPRYTIERKDNAKGYCKENCVWETRKRQNRNKRSNHVLALNNRTMCIADWEDATGIPQRTIWMRLKRGWSVQRTLETPVHGPS